MKNQSLILHLALLSLAEQATRDPLTKLYNRRYFNETLTDQIAVATRYNRPLSLLLLDLDHFKKINDTHGHLQGDQLLCTFAQHITQTIRDADIACRYGGDEFAILLPETTPDGATELLHRLQQNTPHPFSAGLASLPVPNLLQDADKNLLLKKNANP